MFVFLKLGGDELLRTEQVDDVVVVRLFHRLVDLRVAECLVAGDVDLADLRLGFLIDIHEHLHVTLAVRIRLLQYLYIRVVETFLGEILHHHCLGAVGEVRCHLCAFADAYLDFHILFLALLQSVVGDVAHTWALFELNLQPYLVALNLRGGDLHVGEQSLLPESADTFRYLVAGHFDLVAYCQARETDQHKVLVTRCTAYADAGYLVGLARHGVLDLRHTHRRRCRHRRTILSVSQYWLTHQ